MLKIDMGTVGRGFRSVCQDVQVRHMVSMIAEGMK